MSTAFGEALQRERRRRGENQRETAERFGVSQPSYHRWERGDSHPDDKHKHAIAEFLGITVQDVWELQHNATDPLSFTLLNDRVSALERDVEDLKRQLAEALAAVSGPS
ncbi:MAG: helix-turn-helix transcriptional regulator [Acidimicrobiales bacterium]